MNAKISVFAISVEAIIYIYIYIYYIYHIYYIYIIYIYILYIYIYIYIYYTNCMTVTLNRKDTYLISFFVLLDLNFNFWQKNL